MKESCDVTRLSTGRAMGILAVAVGVLFAGLLLVKASSTIALLASGAVTVAMALISGVSWDELHDDICKNISSFIPAILILLSVGMLVGAWIVSGTVPVMIDLGLKMLSPEWFLVATLFICTIMSVTTGTSWGTIGTVGIALMGVSVGLGVPLAYTAGAIVMGAIFGDKLSPLSDTTVLASAVSGVDIFDHVKYMLLTTVPPFAIGIAMYWFLGNGAKGSLESAQLNLILATMEKTFTLSPMLLLPPITVLSLALMKKPALPVFAVGIVLAVILAVFIQQANLKDISSALLNGYAKSTGVEVVDKMLLRGGLKSMLGTVALLIAAAVFGAPLRTIGVMEVLIAFVRKFSNTGKVFQTGVFFLHGFLFMITGSYYVTFSAFAPMVRPVYDDLGLHRVNLSRMLEDTGTAFAPIVPWSVTGAFIATTLDVPTLEFALFAPITYGGMLCALAYIAFNYKIAVVENPLV